MDNKDKTAVGSYRRPGVHFSPPSGWVNDPNGLIYFGGYYHLYYQYYPDGLTHGAMHWGHARSVDLLHWEYLPVALYPDEHGEIFSGSMVYDRENTSGFGTDGNGPLVAVFTHHLERGGTVIQSQSLAYSLDGGNSFLKYAGNPVLNPGLRDFRDPKVFFHEPEGRWIMVLSAGQEVQIYSSVNLKEWEYRSTFQSGDQEPGEIWECPDLFPMTPENGDTEKTSGQEQVWILTFSVIIPDRKYSCVRYFTGTFNGSSFTSKTPAGEKKILDLGYDFYAPVTYENVQSRRILMGWQNRWAYAERLPAVKYRGTMSFPRELKLMRSGTDYRLAQYPVRELLDAAAPYPAQRDGAAVLLPGQPCYITLELPLRDETREFCLTNGHNCLKILVNTNTKELEINRTSVFPEDLGKEWLCRKTCLREIKHPESLRLLVDTNSVELFWGEGEAVCSMLYYAKAAFTKFLTDHQEVRYELYLAGAEGREKPDESMQKK
ncbi:glycoside hydrolase family 32 protein [Diplocloster agilis]|uniref:Glycoside hydrolase family 32 protein n=1 Tax=Diplocloster agilis TaxID=2850323 RepID=A0A949JYG3_9FIRM|nr:glycoside hydrolase family 32 protein [Diplocloster agilis]MBU9736466.1 glycoside hydrolase family 32 protein [Diplocloster agilis]MBU9747167.1 glycoside hydrolase family 32 protein [Diplocloster agilis]